MKERLISVDIMRGVTIMAMIIVNTPGSWSHVYAPLLHAHWNGCTPTDLIFPFFLFIVGISINLAFTKQLNSGKAKQLLIKKAAIRACKLILLGLLLSFIGNWDIFNLRYPGVLQRIGIVFFFGALAFLYLSKKQIIALIGILLVGYYMLLMWVPVPGLGKPSMVMGENIPAWIDQMFLSGHMWSQTKTWDPEGILSTFPALGTCLIGVLTGYALTASIHNLLKVRQLLIWGLVLVLVGFVWSFHFPLNKSLWTSSYVLYAAGWAMLVLGLFIYVSDVKQWKKPFMPFIVFGSNAITVYFLSGVLAILLYSIPIGDTSVYGAIYKGLTGFLPLKLASLMFALIFAALLYGVAEFMYRRKIFIKV